VQLKGLGKLKQLYYLIANRTRDPLAYSIAPQPLRYRVPLIQVIETIHFISNYFVKDFNSCPTDFLNSPLLCDLKHSLRISCQLPLFGFPVVSLWSSPVIHTAIRAKPLHYNSLWESLFLSTSLSSFNTAEAT
jgi:hypothetical protein